MAKPINQEIIDDILLILEGRRLTGYQIFKLLKDKHPRLSSRLVYHYLYMGMEKGYLKVEKVSESGNFSWGSTAEKKYYSLNK
ncbi:hypothetical protein M1293_00575 [Candidatus Parvarchaeota archaeon]|nr:hypothetical protein [Candidatus Parvarchaeota archaeon]